MLNQMVLAALIVSTMLGRGYAQDNRTTETLKAWPDPARFETKIDEFETSAPVTPPAALLAYGSSSIVGWHKWIQEDLKPLTVVPRGFGGSNINDAVHFMNRVVVPAQPRAVLLYEGDNDVAAGQPVSRILDKYVEFITRLHLKLPKTRLYILSVKPSPSRWKLWPQMKVLNAELKRIADADSMVTYIDVATPMLSEQGEPKGDIFLADKLHMNRKGYDIWRDTVRAAIMEHEIAVEADKHINTE